MINLFDLSAGMASTNMHSGRPCRDGSPARRSRQDAKRTADVTKVYGEEKLGAHNRNSSANKSNVLAKEMPKELKSEKKSPSVVARLMGLEDGLPAQESVLHSTKRNLKKSHSHDDLAETNMQVQHREQYYSSMTNMCPKETVQFKDVYEVNEEPLRTYHLQDQTFPRGISSRSRSDIRMEIVRQKFMEAKRLATNDKLLHSKEFQEALKVLSSNRDLFLKFLEEPNSILSKQLAGLHRTPAPTQMKRITVLKPNKSVEFEGSREIRRQRINEENDHVMPRSHHRSHSAEVTFSQPTRIVVLKPSPANPSRTMARLTPRAAPSQPTERVDLYGGLEDDEYLPDGLHRRDESLLSSVYSNGYGGDESSFSRSEDDYIDEEGNNLSDSEIVSPVSRHSWNHINRYNSPYSGSTFSRRSHSPESSVIREAKKRLSERWASVVCDEINQEHMHLPRSSSTLGEMLSIRETKKEAVGGINSVTSSQPRDRENELTAQRTPCISTFREDERNGLSSPRNFTRSKSVPVSSSLFNNIASPVPSSNSGGCETPKEVTRSDKGKSSFKGRVSSFFLPKSKKQTKEKITQSYDSSDGRFEVNCLGSMKPEADHNIGASENRSFCEEKADNTSSQATCSSKDIVSIEVPISSDCPSGYIDVKSGGGLKGIRDQPSPTSVLDASFEDSNINEPESSRSITCSNDGVALRSTVIESVTRSLSWEDMNSPSLGSTKPISFSDVDDDELECAAFVQKIVSSAGLGNLQLGMVFAGWYLPDCPLDPALCAKLLDRKEEAAKSRERRSNQKLLFDCVNMALIEIGQDALLCTYPWSQTHSLAWRETLNPLNRALGEEIPRFMRDWLHGSGRFAVNEYDDAGTMLERMVQEEVEGRGWVKSMRSELDEITEQIARGVLEELVKEAVDDLAICSLQLEIPLTIPIL